MDVNLRSAIRAIAKPFKKETTPHVEFEIFHNIDGSDSLLIPKNPSHNTVRLQFLSEERINELQEISRKLSSKQLLVADNSSAKATAGLLSLEG